MYLDNYTLLALCATTMTWLVTTLGSSMVFFFKKLNKNIINGSYALSAGIMLSASFWSLLKPAIEESNNLNISPCINITLGFILGGLFIFLTDKLFGNKIKTKSKSLLLILSITMHNIPEGLAIGIAFGSIKYNTLLSLKSAWILAIGIAIQNFPEGSAVSLPLRSENNSRLKSFIIGSLSAIVEPIFGIIGCILTARIKFLMPILLSFAAGAMIYVIIKELIPESQSENKSLMTILTLIGFTIMMILDISL